MSNISKEEAKKFIAYIRRKRGGQTAAHKDVLSRTPEGLESLETVRLLREELARSLET